MRRFKILEIKAAIYENIKGGFFVDHTMFPFRSINIPLCEGHKGF
jgi:hypothetical protein